jgi:hypothetical protein
MNTGPTVPLTLVDECLEAALEIIELQKLIVSRKTKVIKNIAPQLRDAWVKAFGDPEDSTVQASIDAVADSLKSQN